MQMKPKSDLRAQMKPKRDFCVGDKEGLVCCRCKTKEEACVMCGRGSQNEGLCADEAKRRLVCGRRSQEEACMWQMKPKGSLCVADIDKEGLRMADKGQRGSLCCVWQKKPNWRLV